MSEHEGQQSAKKDRVVLLLAIGMSVITVVFVGLAVDYWPLWAAVPFQAWFAARQWRHWLRLRRLRN